MIGRRSRLGLTLFSVTAVLSVALAGAAQAAVTVSRAEVSGDRLRIEGRAVANRPITVDGVQMGVSDSSGGFRIERSRYTWPADCTVDVNDGAASPVNVPLSGCTVTAPGPAAALSSVSLNPATVTGGATSSATVTLMAAAPAGGALVSLASSNTAAATVPATLTVPAGVTSATAFVGTSAVGSTSTSVISATYTGATRTATLTVTGTAPPSPAGPPPTGFSLSHTSLDRVGNLSIGAVTFAPDPPTPLDFAVQSSHPNNAQVPATVHVTQFSDPGNPVASFTVNYATVVSAPTDVTITVSAGEVTKTAVLTLRPPPPPTLAPRGAGTRLRGLGLQHLRHVGDDHGPRTKWRRAAAGRHHRWTAAERFIPGPALVRYPGQVPVRLHRRDADDGADEHVHRQGHRCSWSAGDRHLHHRDQPGADLGDHTATVGALDRRELRESVDRRQRRGPAVHLGACGQLPPGMALIQDNPNGPSVRVGGTPTTAGTYTFTLRLTDSRGTNAGEPLVHGERQLTQVNRAATRAPSWVPICVYRSTAAPGFWQQAEVLVACDRADEGLAAAEAGLKLARRLGHRGWTATTSAAAGIARFALGDLAGAAEAFEESQRANGEHLLMFRSWGHARLGMVRLEQGRLDLAADHVAEALMSGPELSQYYARLAVVPARRAQGRP